MANALTYMKNVGKSVAYSSAKVFKDMNPVVKDFTETNASAISGTYKTIRDMKKVSKRISSSVKDTNYYKYGKNTFDNLMSDIKTGKFYNKERIDKYDNDFGGLGEEIDMDFGSSDDLNFGSSDDFGFDDGPSSNEMMDIVGEKASSAVSNAVARSAEYIVQGTAESNRTLYNQMNIVYSGMQSSLSTINENISKVIQFSNEATIVHYENSKTFYEEITRLDNERNQYLREIAEGVKQLNAPAPKRASKEVSGYSDFVSYEGALDIGKYIQQVKKNIKNSDGGITDMLSLIVDMSGGKGMASPISALMELGIEHVFKKSFGTALENFNKSLSGLAGNALLALKNKSKNSFGIWDTISNIFGIDTSLKTSIDTSAYEKGKVPFDGVTKKAITEVIPTYLSKILNALTGKPEDRFDYEKGKFVTVDDLRKELSEMTSRSADRAASDLDWEVRRKKKSLSFRSKEEESQFDADWEAIKQYMYKNQTSFNTRDKKLSGASFGLKGGLESDKNVRRLQGLLDANPEVLKYADSMFRERESQSKRMRDLEASGAGALISLFNGSVGKEVTTQSQATGSKTSVAAAALSGSSVLNELVDIHKELSYIRLYGTGGRGGSGKKGRGGKGPGPVPPSFDNFQIPRREIKEDNVQEYPTLSDEEVDEDISKITEGDKKKFGDRFKEAKGITGKISVFANSILGKVDEGIYSLIYGPKEDNGKPDEKKSFISSLLQGLKGTFQNFSDFLHKKILDPLKERFNGDKVKDFLKNSFEKVFKISFDEFSEKVKDKLFGAKDEKGKRTGVLAKFFDGFKSEMKGAFGWVKNTFKGAGKSVGDFVGATSVKKQNGNITNQISEVKDLFNSKASDIQEAASGLKRVNKTGLAVISEGEMIVPPDMNPFNVSKRQRNERKVKNDLKSGIDSIFEFAEGSKSANFSENKKFSKEDYERAPLHDRILEEASKVVDSLKNAADTFGMSDKDKEAFKEKATKFIGEVKEHGATMAAGATIGAGVSLFTGLLGGPLLGAAVGAGVGLLTRSKTVQDFLFGNEEEGKEGKLPKKLAEGIKKYAPDMAKGGTIGGLLAALPFIPGGPVAGLLVGSAVGFAKNNEKVQQMIWGEDLHRKEDFQKKLQSALPKMGLGATVGLLAGPFGPMANILLGSALGFAADSDKFKEMIFGTEGEDGKRQGGLFGFIKEKILAPVENLFDPLKRRLEDLGESIKNSFKEFFDKKIKEPIDQFIKNTFLKPLQNMFKKIFGGVLGVAKKVVAKPFEWIGNIGTNMRIKDIKQGKARYMSAAEREDMRLAYGDARFRKVGPGKDQFAEFDKSMLNADKGQLSSAQQVLESIQGSYGDIGKLQKESHGNIYNALYHNQDKTLDSKEGNRFSRTVMRMIKSGDYEAAKKFVQDSKFKVSDETRSSLLKVIEDNANKLNMANKMRNNVTGATDEAFELLQQSGINVDKGLIEKVQKGDKGARKTLDQMLTYIKNEAGLRGTDEEQSSEQKKTAGEQSPTEEATAKRHEEILNPVQNIDKNIKDFLEKISGYNDPSKYKIAPEGVEQSDDEFEVTNTEVGKFTKGLNKVRGAKFNTKVQVKEKAAEIKEGIKEKTAEIKEGINEARDNSEFMNQHFGIRSKRKYYKAKRKVPVVVSEGESIVSDVDDVEEHAKGGVAGDGGNKPSGIMKLIKKMTSSLSKIAGVTLASAYKDGVNVDSVDSETDSKTFFSKIKTKFGKAKQTITQFFNGRPMVYTLDKNGKPIMDTGIAENKETLESIDEEQQTQKGILGALTGMPTMLGGLFGKLFNKDDEKESIFDKILGFFTGKSKINLGSVLKNVLPLALVGLGLSGKLDNIASKLTGGTFGSKDANSGITAKNANGENVELKTDKEGNPIKDANGNYVAVNGETVSGDADTRTTKSQATMSLSSRLKYNTVRGAITGKGSIVGAVIKKNPITKPIAKGAAKAKSGLGKVASAAIKAAKDPAAVNEITDKILDSVTKWSSAMKKVPKLAKFADKLDDIGLEIAEVAAKSLPKAGAALTKIKDILGKTNIYVMIAMAVIDFTTGWQDASTTLKIKKENVTIPQKILCGLLRTIKNFIPIIGSFIPDSLITDLFIKHIAGWFKIDVSALKKQRDEAQKELDDYNAENGTNYTWAEYNKKVLGNYTWTEHVWNGATKVGKGIAKGAKVVGKGIAKGAKAAWGGVKKAGSWVADKASGVVEGVKEGVGKVADFVSDKFSDAKDIGAFALAKVKDRAKEIITGKNIESNLTIKEDDPNGKIKKIIYNVINYATALPLGMSKIIHGIFDKVVKPIIDGIKTIGSGVLSSVKNQFTSAWKGDLKGAFTDSSENTETGNKLIDGISKVVNNVVKVPLAVPTLLTAGVGLIVRKFKDIVNGVKTIGSGIGTTVKNQFTNAWNGNFKEIFTDTSGNAQTGNGFVDGVSAVINTVSKFALATPTLITASIGSVVKGVKSVIGFFKQIGPGIGTTVKNQFTNAWNGDFGAIFTDTSGNAQTGNKFVDTSSAVVNTISKVVLAVPTLLTASIGGVVRGVKSAISGIAAIGNGIGSTVTNQFTYAWNGDLKGAFTDSSENTETGNGLVDGISKVINNVVKIPLAIPTLLTAGVGSVVRGLTSFFKNVAEAGTLSSKDKSILEDSKEGKVSLFSNEYWKVNSDLDGLAGGFNKFISITRKVLNIPMALLGWIKDVIPFDDWVKGIKDFFGLDDSETKEKKKNGSGSGLYVGSGSNVSTDTFISQVDPKYKNKSFNISKDTQVQTLGNTGCAPAAAAMAVNATYKDQKLSMEEASKNALKYKVANDGVNASYFNDEFSRHGLSAEYIVSNDVNTRKREIINRLSGNTRVVLMGKDASNTSKAHSPFGPNPHYVVANGLSKDGKYIYINDPESTRPNVKYSADKVLGSSTLGISAHAAMGSKLNILNKVKGFVGRGAYGPDTTEYKVWTKLRSSGYSEVQAAAIMGNIKHESGFKASAIEKGSGIGFGLCQWSYGRRTALENYAKSVGKDASDIGVQLDFLIAELTPGGGAGGYAKYQLMTTTYEGKKWQKDLFNTTTDLETATKAFCYCWERPNEKYAHTDRRVTSAKEYFKEFTGVDAPYTDSTSTGNTSGSEDKSFIGGIGKIFNLLASKYGLSSDTSTEYSDSGNASTTYTADGNVSSNSEHAAKQKALVEKMYSVKDSLIYAQNNAKFPGSRNPEDGSGDCSSTVQWAYKKILGVDPGSWTGAQRTDADTYTVATSTSDESKLQLGDLLLKNGHVEMYAGNGKMIGHGGGNDGKTKGPTEKNLDKSGKYDLVRRWVGFKGSGSGLVGRGSDIHPEPSYNMALKHIKTDEMSSVLPFGLNTDEISQNKSSVMQYNNNKLSGTASNKPVTYTGRASQITNEDKRVVKKSSNQTLLLEAINSIIKLLVKIVTNTDKLNNIFKLLGEYINAASNKNTSEDSKQATLIAKQNLLNSLQSKGSDEGTNTELLKLIENVERIAME